MVYYIIPEYSEWNVGGEDPDDSWSRDSYEGSVTGAKLSEHKDYNGVEVETLPAFAVVVGYQTGDTFGTGFSAVVVDAFDTYEKAEELAKVIDKEYGSKKWDSPRKFGIEFDGKGYYTPWEGYFESLESVGVYEVGQSFRKKYK